MIYSIKRLNFVQMQIKMLFYSLGINTLIVSTVRYESGEKDWKVKMKKRGNEESSETKPGLIRMKKFHFIMLLFLVVFLSAGITTFALAFGDEKAVTVRKLTK